MVMTIIEVAILLSFFFLSRTAFNRWLLQLLPQPPVAVAHLLCCLGQHQQQKQLKTVKSIKCFCRSTKGFIHVLCQCTCVCVCWIFYVSENLMNLHKCRGENEAKASKKEHSKHTTSASSSHEENIHQHFCFTALSSSSPPLHTPPHVCWHTSVHLSINLLFGLTTNSSQFVLLCGHFNSFRLLCIW